MSLLPLPAQTLAWLKHAADSGQQDALVMLHLVDHADALDQWFAKFTDHYSKTIASLCRKLEALERGAKDLPAPDAPVDAGPVADALIEAESALADVAEGLPDSPTVEGFEPIEWVEAHCAEALAAIRPAMRQHGIRTSDLSPAAPTPSPDAYAEGLAERIEQIFLDKTSTPGGPGLLVPDPEDPLGARLAIREIASSLRNWQCAQSSFNRSAWDAAEWLERQARR
jgi:hypothetical protein